MEIPNPNNAALYIVVWAVFTLVAISSCFWMINAIQHHRQNITRAMVVFTVAGIGTALLSVNLAQAVSWVYGVSGHQANIIKTSVTLLCLIAAIYAIVRIRQITQKPK